MLHIGLIVGSTRPGRKSHVVAEQIVAIAEEEFGNGAVRFSLLDLAEFDLPLLDEPVPAITGNYRHDHTLRWSRAVAACDGFVFITPEYNHSIPGALKNAIDFLYTEWADKAAGFVSYGGAGGTRAVEQLRLILAETRTATVRGQVLFSPLTDQALFLEAENWTPAEPAVAATRDMLSQVIDWTGALKDLREWREEAEGREAIAP